MVIGCVGGGSNFSGLAFPFVRKNLTEGILAAPESAHAVAAAVEEAKKAKDTGEEKVILFNLSGHGFLDISAFDGNSRST